MAGKPTGKQKDANEVTVLNPLDVLQASAPPHSDCMESDPTQVPPIAISFGPDDYFRREVIEHLIELLKLDPLSVTRFDGTESHWVDVHDELSTQSLFDMGGPKAAYVRKADDFLSKNRELIERWIEKGPSGAILFLDVQALPSNQRVHRLAVKNGWAIGDKEPSHTQLQKWIAFWGKKRHGIKLSTDQVNVIIDRIGFVGGLIDCELAKLALFRTENGEVSDARVDELVGGWRTQTVWQLTDWVADGEIGKALEELDKLIMAGQSPTGIAAQMSWSLRRYGVAAYAIEQAERIASTRPDLSRGLTMGGFRSFELEKATKRLMRIGRVRAKKLLSWLLELEIELKGTHSQDDRSRIALEEFMLRLAGDASKTPRQGTIS